MTDVSFDQQIVGKTVKCRKCAYYRTRMLNDAKVSYCMMSFNRQKRCLSGVRSWFRPRKTAIRHIRIGKRFACRNKFYFFHRPLLKWTEKEQGIIMWWVGWHYYIAWC